MKISYVIAVLLGLTVTMQAMMLFRDYKRTPIPNRPSQEAIRDAPKGASLDLVGLPTKGSNDARVVLIEFSDYECPFCARHATSVAPQLETEFIDSGKVKEAFVNNPLPIHPNARLLATAAICAGDQNHYWLMHDVLFREKPKSRETLIALAQSNSMDARKFQRCVDSSDGPSKKIDQDIQKSKELQLTSTPTFGIGRIDTTGRVSIRKFVIGAVPLSVFEGAINEALATK